ncbi:MAG: flotillin-like FloA family protein [Acidobacteriota bacterium]
MSLLDALFAIGAWIAVFTGLALVLFEVRWWWRARAAGLDLHVVELVGVRLRGANPRQILPALARAHAADLGVSLTEVTDHALAGGRVDAVVDAMIAARDEGREVSFRQAARRDLAGEREPYASPTRVSESIES